jgi:hypothetical protein
MIISITWYFFLIGAHNGLRIIIVFSGCSKWHAKCRRIVVLICHCWPVRPWLEIITNRRLQKWKATPPIVGCLLIGSGRATMKLHCIQCGSGSVAICNYIAALPLPTTMGGVAYSISEVVYSDVRGATLTYLIRLRVDISIRRIVRLFVGSVLQFLLYFYILFEI